MRSTLTDFTLLSLANLDGVIQFSERILMYNNKNQPGFTLVELVVVMVILAVLAVSLAPKLINLSSDARIAVLEGVEGNLVSSLNNLTALCHLDKACRELPTWPNRNIYIPAYEQTLHMIGGFPEAGTLSRAGEIHDFIDTDGLDVTNPDTTRTRWAFPDTVDCYLQYKQIASGETFPVIVMETSGC